MDREKLKYILTKPITIIILLVLAILSLIAFGIINNAADSKKETVSNMNIETISRDENGKLDVKLVDYEKNQNNSYEEVSEKLKEAANPESENTDKISKYFETRYNYDDGEANNLDNTINAIQDIATDDFLDAVKSSMSKSKDEGKCELTINKIYITGAKSDELNARSVVIPYIFDVNINGKNYLYRAELKTIGGEWKINSVSYIDG